MHYKNDLTYKVTAKDGDGIVTECTATPSMYALADEWVDELCAKGAHTEFWRLEKLGYGICYLALQHELEKSVDENGEPVFPDMRIKGKPTLPAIAWMLNSFDVDYEPVDKAKEEENAENPTPAGTDGNPEPA